jgi:hypothetical protein
MAGSVGHGPFARDDFAGAGQVAEAGEVAHDGEQEGVDNEFDDVGGVVARQRFPQQEEDGLGDGDAPDGAVEVAALGAFALGGFFDAGQEAEEAEEPDGGGEGEVGGVVDLAEAPEAGRDGVGEADEVEQGEGNGDGPGEGVADAAVDGVGAVLGETEDIGGGFDAGEFPEEAGEAGSDEDDAEPGGHAGVKAAGEEVEGQRAGSDEEDEDPDGPVEEAVVELISGAESAVACVLEFYVFGHCSSW